MLQAFLAGELRRLDSSELSWVTITAVDMSPDLKNAKIFWTVPGDEQGNTSGAAEGASASVDDIPGFPSAKKRKAVETALAEKSWHLKKRIADELQLRFVPQLNFKYDESAMNASRLDYLLKKAGVSSAS